MKTLKNYLLRGAALLMVLGAVMPAMARDYVITYTDGGTTYYLGMNGNNLQAKTVPDATCVWTCINTGDNNPADLGTTTRRRIINKQNNTYYLYVTETDNGRGSNPRYIISISASTSNTANSTQYWYGGDGSTLYYYRNGNYGYGYLHNSGSTVTISSSNTNAFTAYAVTVNTVSGISTNPTVTGNDVITLVDDYTFTATSAAYQLGYTNYRYNNANHYYDENGNSFTGAISASSLSYSWALSPTQQGVSVSGTTATGTVSVTNLPESDVTLTITVTVTATGGNPAAPANTTLTGSKTITLQGTKPSSPIISVSSNTITLATNAAGSTSIRYTLDGSDPTATTGTEYDGTPLDLSNSATSPVTIKAVSVRNGDISDVTTQVVTLTLPTPVITINPQAGTAIIACANSYATVYYTTDGSEPSSSNGNVYSPAGISGLSMMQKVKAIAILAGWNNSPVVSATVSIPSGVTGSVVTLNDLEDHTWTYYSAKPDNDYPDQLRSPDPRNVKITYRGGSVNNASAVAVSATESANEFVYYKTIEKKAWGQDEGRWLTGDYAYKVIPNPFQKRPRTNGTTGTNGFYGFAGWKIVSGGEYINGHNNNDVLGLEEKINFVNLPAGNDGTGAVVFEATWTAANVATVNDNVTGAGNLGGTGGTYETNFIVVSGNDRTVTGMTRAATVMGCYPDGTGATGARLSTVTGSANDLKIENINLGTGGSDFTANTGWLIVGRGCTGNVRRVLGNTGQVKIRIESGTYNFINPMSGGSADNANYGLIVFGNDYDRATNDGLTSNDQYTDNSTHRKLRVINYVSFNGSGAAKGSNDNRDEWMDITIKSGYYGYSANYSLYSTTAANDADGFGLGIGGNTDNAGTYSAPDINGTNRTYTNLNAAVNNTTYRWQRLMSFYCGRTRGGNYGGVNRVLVEGGELSSINGGGYRNTGANFDVCYHFRMKGGWVKGAIYGTASSSQTNATTKQVITGGEINGWVAGACNGTDVDNAAGENLGDTYIYLGGTAELRSHRKDGVYNNAWGLVGGVEGGNLFASGRGTPATNAQPTRNYCGSSYKTYAVVADQSQVEQGVYGGGYIGVAQNSHIYITGGTTGKVFGGASTPTSTNNTWMTQTTDIRMYGGTVKEGIYGGHFEGTGNAGKIHQTVNIAIDGGQVGVDADHTGMVHGGGYGAGTSVGTDVTVTLGKVGAADSATIFGNVYGGGALGDVNSGNTNTTTVTLNKALVNGNLFGGALGVGADVNGKITVTIAGGTVNGSVFGGGDAAAYSPNANYPVVNMTGGQATNVFGGGMGNTAVVTGNPQVTLSGSAHVTGNVYGGGNAAPVTGNTSVILQD